MQNIECTKHNRQVKPKYYGEALTRDKIIERMEEVEREKEEKKAQKMQERLQSVLTTVGRPNSLQWRSLRRLVGHITLQSSFTCVVHNLILSGEVCQECGGVYDDDNAVAQLDWV